MRASKSKAASTPSISSGWYYFVAILPLPLLLFLGSSQILRSTIAPPPSDHGTGSMFDLIATRYDFINRALALNLDMGWRHRLVSEVVGHDGELFTNNNNVQLLDLATGTADVAILLGKAAAKYASSSSSAKSASVLGLDPSQNMLNVGHTKVKDLDLANIVSLKLGDARKLSSLDDNSIDAATMSFGIRNVPEKAQALCEINRVLKKGSADTKLAIMEFSEPGEDSGIMGSLARAFIRHVIPSLGALLSGAPREYMHLQKSIQDFPSPSEFVELIEGVKCPVKSDDGEDEELQVNTFGTFRVKKVVNLNFDSVQIYVATPVLKTYVTE